MQYDVTPKFVDRCRAAQDEWYRRIIPQLHPDIVVLVDRYLDGSARPKAQHYIGPRGERFGSGDAYFEQRLISLSRESLAVLRRPGRHIVIIEPIPVVHGKFDPLNCLSTGRRSQDCTYQAPVRATPLERAYRRAATAPDITSLDMDRLICPRLPTCDPMRRDVIIKRDGSHLTGTFAHSLWSDLDRMLHAAQVLPAARVH